jgi:hypothetical protein
LPPFEQAEFRRLETLRKPVDNGDMSLKENTVQQPEDLHRRLHLALYEAGLVSDINPPHRKKRERRPPIEIKGKPLSETIIEDRR